MILASGKTTRSLNPQILMCGIISSRPFEFFVKGKSFFIHRALISKVSVPLDRLINWGMPEAQKSQAVLEGEDDATFARFCHWAYTGLYYAEGFLERPERETLTVEIGDDGLFYAAVSIIVGLYVEQRHLPILI